MAEILICHKLILNNPIPKAAKKIPVYIGWRTYLYNPVWIRFPFSIGVGKGVRFLFNCKMAIKIIKKPLIEITKPGYFKKVISLIEEFVNSTKNIANRKNWTPTNKKSFSFILFT